MPITSSAKKALRSSAKKREFNLARKEAMKEVVKKIKKLVSEKKAEEAAKLLPKAYELIDKAAKMYTIKDGAASRKKSRLSRLLKKAKASA